jgi:two-component system sensor kinase FixL
MAPASLNSALPPSADSKIVWWRTWLPRSKEFLLLAGYAASFMAAHALAALWGGIGFYSLWFPAAGLRLALLWHAGARLTPAAALVEVGVDVATGVVTLATSDWAWVLIGIVRPVIAYGLIVAAVRHWTSGSRAEYLKRPMPLALAMVLAPPAAALLALPQAWLRPDLTGVAGLREIVMSLSIFTIGDMLGVLLIAPPVLWVCELLQSREKPVLDLPRPATLMETAGVLGLGIGIGMILAWLGLGFQPAPSLMAVAWIGLRFGRAAAWGALLLVSILVLQTSTGLTDTAMRLQLHLGLTTIVMVGYLAGSFADAQTRARADLARRDRLLFQAERLKTLRAMSVSVIHEISQPLSTLAIEARHLHELTVSADPDVASTAALIDRKAEHLSTLVRRLRRFGGRALDEPSALPVTSLIDSVIALARSEADSAGVRLAVLPVDPDIVVVAQEVELAQAIMNVLRNAVQASANGDEVFLSVRREGASVAITVSNTLARHRDVPSGMGVGTLIARAIVEAHGGELARTANGAGVVDTIISLPTIKGRP